jgi:hypothetical protein
MTVFEERITCVELEFAVAQTRGTVEAFENGLRRSSWQRQSVQVTQNAVVPKSIASAAVAPWRRPHGVYRRDR